MGSQVAEHPVAVPATSEKEAQSITAGRTPGTEGSAITEVKKAEGTSPGTLTPIQIATRLEGLPHNVAKEMFAFVQKLSDIESARQQRLDAKATALLTAIGLSLTVAFTFGAFLLKDGGTVWKAHWAHDCVVGVFVAALVCAGTSAACAIAALLITPYSMIGEDAVFNQAILDRVREDAEPEAEGDAAPDPKKVERAEAVALAQYHQSMTIAIWVPVVTQRANHQKKARWVGHGQWAFAGFLFVVLVLFGFLGYAAYTAPNANVVGPAAPTATPSSPAAPSAHQ